MRIRPPSSFSAWHAAVLYLAAAAVWTWPLIPHLSSAIAWDLGDPMLLSWIMGWVNDSVLALFRGDLARFAALWDPPIFYPEPLALAFSDHLIPQALMVLPVHALTGNVVLSYNIALLLTFVLSGVGMFLLARELTGSSAAGLLAGAAFAFAPYRVDQLSHLQVLSSEWMPFAIYGLRRYFVTLRIRPLIWAVLALAAACLSCGYYAFYFPPFVLAYVLFEMRSRGLLRDRRTWIRMTAAGTSAAALVVPFLVPYLAAREAHGIRRRIDEIQSFSADVYAYATSPAYIRWSADLLDAMRDAGENVTFPGVVLVMFTLGLLAVLVVDGRRRWTLSERPAGPRKLLWTLLALIATGLGAGLWIAITGGRIFEIDGHELRVRNIGRLTLYIAVVAAGALAVSSRLREAVRGNAHSVAGAALLMAFAAFMLSLGPRMESRGEFVGEGPYKLLLLIPGVDGLRVPSRMAMVVVFWLSVASAYLAGWLHRTRGAAVVAFFALAAVVESRPAPFLIEEPFHQPDAAPLSMLHRLRASAPVYDALGREPRGVLVELPWGKPGWDIQFMHLQRRHGWPLVNGYSGHFPESYMRMAIVETVFEAPDRAWWTLDRSGATHVIVHEWAFRSTERGKRVSQWLRDNGAVEVAATENDRLFRLPDS